MDELAKEFGGNPYIFRPNRDVRFSHDKRPYKTSVSGYLADRPKMASATYLECSAQGLFAATGYYQMASDQLECYRSALISSQASIIGKELQQILDDLNSAGVEVGGERLKTSPRGVPRDAENSDLLKYKSLVISGTLSIEKAQDTRKALDFVAKMLRLGEPLGAWLDHYVGASTLPDTFR